MDKLQGYLYPPNFGTIPLCPAVTQPVLHLKGEVAQSARGVSPQSLLSLTFLNCRTLERYPSALRAQPISGGELIATNEQFLYCALTDKKTGIIKSPTVSSRSAGLSLQTRSLMFRSIRTFVKNIRPFVGNVRLMI